MIMSYHLPGIPPYPAPPHLEQSMLVKYLHDVCSHTENQIHSNEQTHFLWIHTRVDGCFHIQTNDLKKINPDILLHSLTHPPILIYLKSAEPPMPRVTATPAPPPPSRDPSEGAAPPDTPSGPSQPRHRSMEAAAPAGESIPCGRSHRSEGPRLIKSW